MYDTDTPTHDENTQPPDTRFPRVGDDPTSFDADGLDAAEIVGNVRSGFERRLTRALDWRRNQLSALEAMLRDISGPQASEDYGRIISDDHFERIARLIDAPGSGTVAFGDATDPTTATSRPRC